MLFSFEKEETECVSHKIKRSRLHEGNENEENSTETRTDSEAVINVESPTVQCPSENKRRRICDDAEESSADIGTDSQPITVESPGPTATHSQEDVMIVGDVQVARPEVIDLERLPTIRQGD